jgi:VIT family
MPLLDYLKPEESLTETIFGLIMMLSCTLAAGVATKSGQDGVNTLLLAAVGGNIAWGIIDAVLGLMSTMFDRRRRIRMTRAIHAAPNERTALAAIQKELDPYLEQVARAEDRAQLYRSILTLLSHGDLKQAGGIKRDDLAAALAVFCLVAATAIPAALPFLFISDPRLALRLSNALLIGLLFLAGYYWARYIDLNPWLAGFGLVGLGLALVAIAIALGG